MLRQSLLLLLVAALAAVGSGVVAAGGVAARRLTLPPPPVYATVSAPASVTVAVPAAPPVPVPPTGSLALATASGASLAASDAEAVRPTGSVAKTMTALLTLRAHPLAAAQPGPVLTMTDADVALYHAAVAEQGSAVPVEAGERLTERQLLLALMLPSANNIAETLGRWVAGGDAAFVSQLNLAASAMGMDHTHFADASGYSAGTVSTAADLTVLGRAALANPALMDIAATETATLPDGTVLRNLDVLLSLPSPRWLGIKTGWTPAAGGCLLFAASATVPGGETTITVVGAVLGQPPLTGVAPGHPELGGAFHAALAATRAALAGYRSVDLTASFRTITGQLAAPWGNRVALALRHGSRLLVVRGPVAVMLRIRRLAVSAPASGGTVVAVVEAQAPSSPPIYGQLVMTAPLAGPSWSWRLIHM